jgi:cephalosporin hydroxylase
MTDRRWHLLFLDVIKIRRSQDMAEFHDQKPIDTPPLGGKSIEVISETRLRVGDYTFDLDLASGLPKPSEDKQFVMMKTLRLVREFEILFQRLKPKNVFELGIRYGGSMALFNLAFAPSVHVAIDIAPSRIPGLDEIAQKARAEGRLMRAYYGVSQADGAALRGIVTQNFGGAPDRPLDLVIDDASHFYPESKASFEALFPYLRAGGVYVIEDWAWAHWRPYQPADHPWAKFQAPSNLIFLLVMLRGSQENVVQDIVVTPDLVYITRGQAKLDPESFRIEDYILARGKSLNLL